MGENYFIKHVNTGSNREDIKSMYIGAISTVLENSMNKTAKEQIERMIELQKYFTDEEILIDKNEADKMKE